MRKPIILDSSQSSLNEDVKIEFPCEYPIKAIGSNKVDLKQLVIETVKPFASDLDESLVTTNLSGKGNFVSVRFVIMATGEKQLADIHEALKATGHVKMVI